LNVEGDWLTVVAESIIEFKSKVIVITLHISSKCHRNLQPRIRRRKFNSDISRRSVSSQGSFEACRADIQADGKDDKVKDAFIRANNSFSIEISD
jgi:hypothetical protein